MISNHDRSGYFGASDTKFIVGNWKTKTWEKWFVEKLGFAGQKFNNVYTLAGTHYEHAILDSFANYQDIKITKDEQIILQDLLLRVNFDGTSDKTIYEVKTHKNEWKLKKEYWQQCQIQMFAKNIRNCFVLSYKLDEKHYKNFFVDIVPEKIVVTKIEYDEDFVNLYLEKLVILKNALKQGKFPER